MRLAGFFALAALRVTASDAWIPKGGTERHCMASQKSPSSQRWENHQQQQRQGSSSTLRMGLAPVEIIGAGRVGSLLGKGEGSTILGRQDSINPEATGPILIATRNDALEGIVENCPAHRRKDLVFLQNGYLDKFLESKGLLDNTQVLLYLSVPSMGAEPADGVTSVSPEGLTAATGIHSQAFADRLAALNLKCKVVTKEQYRPAMFEKLIWISTYMLVGTAKECKSVGEAGSKYGDLVEKVVNELVAAVSAKEGITFEAGTMARLAAYTDVVADFPCGVKEFQWRNQYFYDLGDAACPTHNALLRECKEKGLLGFDLPQ